MNGSQKGAHGESGGVAGQRSLAPLVQPTPPTPNPPGQVVLDACRAVRERRAGAGGVVVACAATHSAGRWSAAAAAATAPAPYTVVRIDGTCLGKGLAALAQAAAARGGRGALVVVDSASALALAGGPHAAAAALDAAASTPGVVAVLAAVAEGALEAGKAAGLAGRATVIARVLPPPEHWPAALASRPPDGGLETAVTSRTGRVSVSRQAFWAAAGGGVRVGEWPSLGAQPPPATAPPPSAGGMSLTLTPAEAAARARVVLPHDAVRGDSERGVSGRGEGGGPTISYVRDSDTEPDSDEDVDDALEW